MMVGRVLTRLQQETDDFQIEEVDILAHPLVALKEGIKMIPTLQINKQKLSGVFLSEEQIREFLTQ
jgi:hypothetical protein